MTNQEMLNAYNGLKLFQEKEAQIYKEDGKKILSGKIKLSYAINKNTNLLLNALKPYAPQNPFPVQEVPESFG